MPTNFGPQNCVNSDLMMSLFSSKMGVVELCDWLITFKRIFCYVIYSNILEKEF